MTIRSLPVNCRPKIARLTSVSRDVALEHVLWARGQGWSPRTVIASVGAPVLVNEPPTWADAAASVQAAWVLMRAGVLGEMVEMYAEMSA